MTEFGEQPESPEISIVIPLYKRVDLIEQQLAEFVLDPEIARSRPRLRARLAGAEGRAAVSGVRLFPVYRVPMRIAILERNVGFAGANNAGASIARGRLLMLMNSDVLPDKPGWLERAEPLPRLDAEHRRARPQASLRGRLDPERGHEVPPASRHLGLARRPLLPRACTAAFPPPTCHARCRCCRAPA